MALILPFLSPCFMPPQFGEALLYAFYDSKLWRVLVHFSENFLLFLLQKYLDLGWRHYFPECNGCLPSHSSHPTGLYEGAHVLLGAHCWFSSFFPYPLKCPVLYLLLSGYGTPRPFLLPSSITARILPLIHKWFYFLAGINLFCFLVMSKSM